VLLDIEADLALKPQYSHVLVYCM